MSSVYLPHHHRRQGTKRSSTRGGRGHLTARQQQVLRLALEGQTTAEIGETMGIRYDTVQHHLSSVYRNLGITRWVGARGLTAALLHTGVLQWA